MPMAWEENGGVFGDFIIKCECNRVGCEQVERLPIYMLCCVALGFPLLLRWVRCQILNNP